MKFQLVFAHLLNDSSGSPRVLLSTIAACSKRGEQMKLLIGSDGDGCLSKSGIPTSRYWYKRMGHRILTFFTYFSSQLLLFLKLLTDRSIERDAVIYVNTLLPFGAALYGAFTGRRVIYHVHEISISPSPLKYLLLNVARLTSSLNIYVSDAHGAAMPIKGVPSVRLHNMLDPDLQQKASMVLYSHRRDGLFRVLMVASLRDYKGVPEFLTIGRHLLRLDASIRFDLLVNDDQEAIDAYFLNKDKPCNVVVHPRTGDPAPFYATASVVVNLSRVDQWVETFGLTILEAMAFGIPVIVPPVGGPTELVEEGRQGYLIDSRYPQLVADKILHMAHHPESCEQMSAAGRKRASEFAFHKFEESLNRIIKAIRKEV